MPFPKTPGPALDAFYKLREERKALERSISKTAAAKRVEKMKEREAALEKHIIDTFKKSEIEGALGKVARGSVSTASVPSVKDWPRLYAYIKRTGAFDLLNRAVSVTAWRERIEAKKRVPGVEAFNVVRLSVRKR